MLLKRIEKRTVWDICYSDCIPTVAARIKGAVSHKEYKKMYQVTSSSHALTFNNLKEQFKLNKSKRQEATSWVFAKRGRVESGITWFQANPNQRLEQDLNPGQLHANPTP